MRVVVVVDVGVTIAIAALVAAVVGVVVVVAVVVAVVAAVVVVAVGVDWLIGCCVVELQCGEMLCVRSKVNITRR